MKKPKTVKAQKSWLEEQFGRAVIQDRNAETGMFWSHMDNVALEQDGAVRPLYGVGRTAKESVSALFSTTVNHGDKPIVIFQDNEWTKKEHAKVNVRTLDVIKY